MAETKVLASEVKEGDVVVDRSSPDNPKHLTVEAIEEHEVDWQPDKVLAFLSAGHWHYFDADDMLDLQVEIEPE